MDIKTTIEAQRERLDCMAVQTDDLTKLLDESQRMDRLIEIYEARRITERSIKEA